MVNVSTLAYAVCIPEVVLFGIVALVLTRRFLRINPNSGSPDFFLTARDSSPEWIIAWSYYASNVGSWVIFALPAYVVSAGIVGLVAFAVSCGLPVLVVAHLGTVLRKKYPHIVSITDFARWRFGRAVQLYVAALMLLNMFLALVAEYTAIGNLFVYTLGGSRVPIVLTVAVITSIYTAAGGLYISILTDVVQGMISVFLLLLLYAYVAATFRPGHLPPLNHELGPNYWGYSAIICQPLANITGTLFSEGPWQRAWASKNDRALKRGALWASMLLVVVCFFYGFGGFLAIWSGHPLSDPTGSTAFFALLDPGGTGAPTWILIVVAVAAVAMNAGDVDTWENAITNTFSAVFLRNFSTRYIRIFVLLINIPAVAVSLQGYNINSLFLVGGTLCTMSAAPILLGMWDRVSKRVTSGAALFGCFTGFWSIVLFGYIREGNIANGMNYVFFKYYDWPSFLIPIIASTLGVGLWAAAETAIRKFLNRPFPVRPVLADDGETNPPIPELDGRGEDTLRL